jgi:MYXO-CTERM domain-containing protein
MPRRALLIVLAAVLIPTLPASAVRPTEGGMFSFEADDVVEYWDEATGAIRVHYSVDGPSQTRMDDDDGDGIPDFPQDIANTAAIVLDFYALETGLWRPLTEDQMGLSELGGSYALDIYLVDFAGSGDGAFGIDKCESDPDRCSGFLSIENDFSGYGYPSLQMAIDVLTSHELFHGIQNAYFGDYSVWFAEGTAVWGELQYDPDSRDFMWFADAYLEDTSRSLDRPPAGPVPAFAYGTCIWWDFMTTRLGVDAMHELMASTVAPSVAPVDVLQAMEQLIDDGGESLDGMWFDFATWNLATGPRSGATESYGYADDLDGILAEAEGSAIDDDNRFYPLAATYYRLDHAGGPIWFGAEEPAEGLRFALHPVEGGGADGPVEAAVDSWTAPAAESWALADGADLPAGGYWMLGTYPAIADESIKVRFCLGDRATAEACAPAAAGDDDDASDDDDGDDDDDDGCQCSAADGPRTGTIAVVLLTLLAVAIRRSHRSLTR